MRRPALLAALLVAAAPVAAQDAEVRSGDTTLVIPAPQGYCSAGAGVDGYLAFQRSSGGEVPDAVFMPCGAQWKLPFDIYAIKVLPGDKPQALAPFLAELRRTMPRLDEGESLVGQAHLDAIARRLSRAIDTQLSMKGGVQPVGVDDRCGYIAGAVTLENGDSREGVALVGCVSVAGGRVVYVFRLMSSFDGGRGASAMPDVRRLAETIRRR